MRKFFGWIVMAAMVLTSCSKTEPKQENQAVPAKTEASSEVNPPDVKLSDGSGDEKVAVADKKESEPAPQGETIDHSEALALLNSVEYSEEGLKSMFKTEGNWSDLEYEALLLAVGRCPLRDGWVDYDIGGCPASDVYDYMVHEKLKIDCPDDKNDVYNKVLKGEGARNPALRSFIYSQYRLYRECGLYVDADLDSMKSFVEFAKAEKDGGALRYAAEALAMHNELYKSPESVDFVLDTLAKHPYYRIRRIVAEGMVPGRYEGVDSDRVKSTLLALCNDKEANVRKAACGQIFDFEIDNAEQLAKEYLKDPTITFAHGELFKYFTDKAFDRDNPDESAYRVVMDYLKSMPRADEFPYYGALEKLDDLHPLKFESKNDFAQWTKKAPFYVEKEMIAALNDLILDDEADTNTRRYAASALLFFGSKKDIEALNQTLKAANNPKNQLEIEHLERLLKK